MWQRFFAAILLSAVLMIFVSGAKAKAAPTVPLLCTVSGAKLLSPDTSAADICSRVAVALSQEIAKPVRQSSDLSVLAKPSKQWLKVNIQLSKPGIAKAAFSSRLNGRTKSYPIFSISVTDRAMDRYMVTELVRELRRLLKS